MQSVRYDENLNDNKFYKTLRYKHSVTHQVAVLSRSTIFVPCSSSLRGKQIDTEFIDSHIVRPTEGDTLQFNTLNDRILCICGNVITTGEGFPYSKDVSILFEETYFNDDDQSYLLICISEPLHYQPSVPQVNSSHKIRCYSDCVSILFHQKGGDKCQRLIDRILATFRMKLERDFNGSSLTRLVDETSDIFTLCMQTLLRNPLLKSAGHDIYLMDALKFAMENYVLHNLYSTLFRRVSDYVTDSDEAMNRVTRTHRFLQIRDLGIRTEFCRNIPKARKELSALSSYTTPISKLNVLKCAIKALLLPAPKNANEVTMTTDDLLPILIFLVVKMELPNWWANLTYMQSFNFSNSSKHDEIGFHLACLEAALSHVTSGLVLLSGVETDMGIQLLNSNAQNNIWSIQDLEKSAVDHYFECVAKDDVEAVKLCLFPQEVQSSDASQSTDEVTSKREGRDLCHPLCSCPKCKSEPRGHRCVISTNTRDTRGYTAVHICAELGHVSTMEYLLSLDPCCSRDSSSSSPPPPPSPTRSKETTSVNMRFNTSVETVGSGGSASSSASSNGSGAGGATASTASTASSSTSTGYNKLDTRITSSQTYNGSTALHLACQFGHQCIALLLLHYGASITRKDNDGNTPVHIATITGQKQCLTAMMYVTRATGTVLDIQNMVGDTALHYASKWGFYSMADLLLENGATADLENRRRLTPTRYALSNHMIRLLKAYSSQQRMNRRHHKPVRNMSFSPRLSSSIGVAEFRGQADRGVGSSTTLSTLNEATRRSSTQSVSSKVEKSTHDRNNYYKDNKEVSPIEKLLRTVANGDIPMVKHHLNWYDENDMDLRSVTLCHPLCQCVKCEPVHKFQVSMNQSLNVNTKNEAGYTPLHVSVQYGHFELSELLIKRCADIEAATIISQFTPLHLACKYSQSQMIILLLHNGADTMATTVKGQTAYDLCESTLIRQTLLRNRSLSTVNTSKFKNEVT